VQNPKIKIMLSTLIAKIRPIYDRMQLQSS
jgi:hypothetical protein